MWLGFFLFLWLFFFRCGGLDLGGRSVRMNFSYGTFCILMWGYLGIFIYVFNKYVFYLLGVVLNVKVVGMSRIGGFWIVYVLGVVVMFYLFLFFRVIIGFVIS